MEDMFRDSTRKNKKRKKKTKATLSFALDDDEDVDVDEHSREESSKERDDTPPTKRSRSHKNPDVDTSFLPDREREEAERRERERLRLEWLTRQDTMKKEDIEITYSYWDGSGHRKSVIVSYLYLLALPDTMTVLSVQERGRHCKFPRKMPTAISRIARHQRR